MAAAGELKPPVVVVEHTPTTVGAGTDGTAWVAAPARGHAVTGATPTTDAATIAMICLFAVGTGAAFPYYFKWG